MIMRPTIPASRRLVLPVVFWVLLALGFCAAEAAETNGTGGGPWLRSETWAEKKLPGPDEPVKVVPGDALQIGGTKGVSCGGLTVEEGGRVVFGPVGGRLTCTGDVEVKGALTLGSGSELLIDCPENMRYGIFVAKGGSLTARGSHGFERNCVLSAARRDGKHNTFIRFDPEAKGSFRFCELAYLGGRPPKDSRTPHAYGLFFTTGVTVEGCHIHHCYTGVHLITGATTLQHNLFTENEFALNLYRPTNVTVTGNRFLRNRVGLIASGKHTEASCSVHGNLFEANKVGMEVRGLLAPSRFYGNVYLDNEIGLRIASANAPIAEECFAGNQHAIELAPKTTAARLLNVVFGVFQGERQPNQKADVLVAAPGPSNLTLDNCRFDLDQPVEFAPEAVDAPGGPRWVVSRRHNGVASHEKRWEAVGVKSSWGQTLKTENYAKFSFQGLTP
ncbi:MAG: right-handed parallel beta-helix repeat-containing protein [Planctomycetes bacterium]|nr:right-handed parallel beta-helix repeat-containing protein [Planctomycetota bacterium]